MLMSAKFKNFSFILLEFFIKKFCSQFFHENNFVWEMRSVVKGRDRISCISSTI